MASLLLPWAVFLSGACGLLYQTLWLRSFSLVFGGTTHAASLVLAVFMGGLGLGGLAASKLRFARPLRSYALAEAGMGISALASLAILTWLPSGWGSIVSSHPLGPSLNLVVKACLAGLTILPATFFSGLTLPLALGFLESRGLPPRPTFGSLYLRNTLGAIVGVTLGMFFIPGLGMSATLTVAALANLAIGGTFFLLSSDPATQIAGQTRASETAPKTRPSSRSLPVAALSTGLSAFILEMLWTRSLCLVVGSSVYAYQLMLLATLAGILLGTGLYDRLISRRPSIRPWLAWLSLALGLAILSNLWVLGQLPDFYLRLMRHLPQSFAAHQAATLGLCLASLLPVTVLQGALFPLLLHFSRESDPASAASGRLYAWNMTGAVLGALGCGFFLIPSFGLQANYVLAAVPLLLLGWHFLASGWKPERRNAGWAVLAVLLAALGTWYRPWDPSVMSSGVYLYGQEYRRLMPPGTSLASYLHSQGSLPFYQESAESLTTVRLLPNTTLLQINGKTDASTGLDAVTQKLVAHLPLMAHPAPRNVLVIGWGSGATAASATLYRPDRLDCVEIEPATLQASPYFRSVNRGLRPGPGFSQIVGDGRNLLLEDPRSYDVIISEPSNAWIQGNSRLFTTEFYKLVRSRLASKGIFGQWFNFYDATPDDLRSELRTFCEVFPQASLWIVPSIQGVMPCDLILLGSSDAVRLDGVKLAAAFQPGNPIGQDLKSVQIDDPLDFACSYVMDRQDMLSFAGSAALNTDDQPFLEFSLPRNLYGDSSEKGPNSLKTCLLLGNASREDLPPVDLGPAAGAQAARRLLDMAAQCYQRDLFQRAGKMATRALTYQPHLAEAHVLQAKIYSLLGDAARAESALLEAVKADPKDWEAANGLGKFYYATGRWEESRATFQDLAHRFPGKADAFLGLGASLVQLRRWPEARDSLERCLQLDPSQPLAKQYLETVEASAGR
jgi:spermidine synthase